MKLQGAGAHTVYCPRTDQGRTHSTQYQQKGGIGRQRVIRVQAISSPRKTYKELWNISVTNLEWRQLKGDILYDTGFDLRVWP